MKVLVLLTLLVVKLHLTRCQGLGAGGPSTFGYDASSACSKPYSRNARARFANLPCDFRQQNWCTVAGNAYPWNAVRRFVRENQGLMKRMYGDERHINILKTELEKNDVELEFEDSYQRYPEDSRRFEYDEDLEYNNPRYLNIQEEPEGRGFTSRALNIGSTKLNDNINKKFSKLGEYTKTHFYPSENPTSTSSTSTTTSTTAKSTTVIDKTSTLSSSSTTTTKTTLIPTTPPTKSSMSTPNSTDLDINSTTIKNLNDNETLSTTSSVTLAEIVQVQNLSINEIPGQTERFESDVDELTEFPIVSDDEEESLEEATTKFSNLGSIDRIDDVPEVIDEVESGDQTGAESEQQQEFRPRPEYRPPEMKNNASSMEGQLYQDVAAKEQKQPIFKGQGVLACPVKEEVVAPFWANNTRGEVLALLNLYPFEQYVHWEKCTHEEKQMYCRDGCKCEQQYRLHRLLAYDPNNECRGIFSDWFKFPSCCLCRCYNLPVEFRVTSRSPRMQKQKVKLRVSRN